MRSGIIATKLGMIRLFDENGRHVPVTVLHVEDLQVVSTRTEETNGYTAVQLGARNKKAQRVSKPLLGHFKKNGVEPKQFVKEFRVSADNLLEVGAEINADHFEAGQKVDVTSNTRGRGFTGAMVRWNFGGMRATHGVSISHRAHGSTGQNQNPGKVFKGKKMAGHYGDETVTTQNLEVVKVDTDKNVIMLKGAVPGFKGATVYVKDAVKINRKPAAK